MLKRYTPGSYLPDSEDEILQRFLSDHDVALQLIHPSMRHQWQLESQKDPKASDSKFIKFNSMEELRRILAKRTYGTKTYLNKKDWERPFLQSYLD